MYSNSAQKLFTTFVLNTQNKSTGAVIDYNAKLAIIICFYILISGEASPTIIHCYGNFFYTRFIQIFRNQSLLKYENNHKLLMINSGWLRRWFLPASRITGSQSYGLTLSGCSVIQLCVNAFDNCLQKHFSQPNIQTNKPSVPVMRIFNPDVREKYAFNDIKYSRASLPIYQKTQTR